MSAFDIVAAATTAAFSVLFEAQRCGHYLTELLS